jgi:hypothetical protein
MRGKRERRWG